MPLVLGEKIYLSIKNNHFNSFIILGDRDIGKSTYSLKALYEAFLQLRANGLGEKYRVFDEPSAWLRALECIKFTIPSVTSYLRKGIDSYENHQIKKPAIIWDDLRKYASGQEYNINRKLYKEITGLLDTIKIPLNVFIGTCPGMGGVMKILQDYNSYQINLGYSTRGGNYRIANGYLWKTTPKGQRYIYHKWCDTFLCRLPNWVWRDYEKQRIEISKLSVTGVEEAYEEGIEKN